MHLIVVVAVDLLSGVTIFK